uniref:Uncharacterized protein n=1 Tax=Sipha flava TaxID=143950 RepID=A0A2S2QF74_9HEMI
MDLNKSRVLHCNSGMLRSLIAPTAAARVRSVRLSAHASAADAVTRFVRAPRRIIGRTRWTSRVRTRFVLSVRHPLIKTNVVNRSAVIQQQSWTVYEPALYPLHYV